MIAVSVIIPVYNKDRYLKDCLDSICHQSLLDIEIICINDCSTDESLNILQDCAECDSRIKVINFEQNKGVSVARNAGIEQAEGEYISFVDADDYISVDFLEGLYRNSNNADIVRGTICEVQNGKFSMPGWQVSSVSFLENPANFIYGFTSAIYKKAFIKANRIVFPKNICCLEDPYFLIWAVAKCKTFTTYESAKYYYRILEKKEIRVDFVIEGIFAILELLKHLGLSKKHYLTVFEFIYHINLSLCASNEVNLESQIKLKKNLQEIINMCLYKSDFMQMLIKKIRIAKK